MSIYFKRIIVFPCLLLILHAFSCKTYYEQNIDFQNAFASGNMQEADHALEKNKKARKKKNRLLYYLDKGVVLQMQKKFTESNEYFEKAYIYLDDYKKRIGAEAISFMAKPDAKPYAGEDFEKVLLHYYKAVNYIQLNDFEAALIECKRINIKLNELYDKFEYREKKIYKNDAFGHLLMGLIYDATGQYNDAFIAYRNAYETYKEVYSQFTHHAIPLQLKKDLIRTSYILNFKEDHELYKNAFNLNYSPTNDYTNRPELILFWHNGMSPVKEEKSFTFSVIQGGGSIITLSCLELGLVIPISIKGFEEVFNKQQLKIVRVVLPKYKNRYAHIIKAEIDIKGQTYSFEKVEDINKIATASLHDRLARELSSALLRAAIKQASEFALSEQSKEAASLLSITNAIMEKADTRNWQTLPGEIYYVKIPLEQGNNELMIKMDGKNKKEYKEILNFNVSEEGKKIFHFYHSL